MSKIKTNKKNPDSNKNLDLVLNEEKEPRDHLNRDMLARRKSKERSYVGVRQLANNKNIIKESFSANRHRHKS
jgi:hypothetical protein